MPTNDFKAFAIGGGANVLSQAAYTALTALIADGFQTGTAESDQLNKVWRQSSAIAEMIGQFIVDETGLDALDDGNIATLLARFKVAVPGSILGTANNWTKGQRGDVQALPATTGTVTLDLSDSNNWAGTLTGAITLANPSVMEVGQSGVLTFTQGATPYAISAFGGYWKGAAGTLPVLTSTASAVDDLVYYVESATRIVVAAVGDVR